MSADALTKLVHRALTADRALRPYLPTRYEADTVPTPGPEEHAEVTPAPPSGPLGEPPAERGPRLTRRSGRGEPAATPSGSHGTESPPPSPGPDLRLPVEQHPRPAAEDAANPPSAAPVPPLVVEPPGSPRNEPSVAGPTPRPAEPGPRPRTAHPAPPGPDGHGRFAPRAAAVTPLAPTTVATGTPPPPEPVVQITIGRVEVRARGSVGPPAAPPTRRSSPVMALDDYLDRRRRGLS